MLERVGLTALLTGCSDSYEDVSVTYYEAALNPLVVGNNKTLLGKGSGGGM